MKFIPIVSLVGICIALTGCETSRSVLVTRNNWDVIQPPQEMVAECPQTLERVVHTGSGGRYTEEEVAIIANQNRVAYMSCKMAIQHIVDFYKSQKQASDSQNGKK